jgi:ketosteroid isomerase-like protein
MGANSDDPVRCFAEAITRCDVDAALAVCDPEVAFLSVLAVDGRPYVGHEGIRRYFDDITSAWEEWRVDIHGTALASDGRVVIEMTMHARGKGSGAPLAEFAAHIWTLRNGKLLRNEPFREPEQAARAAGLSFAARIYAAINARDRSAIEALTDPGIVVATTVEAYRGPAALLEWLDEGDDAFDDFSVELLEVEELRGYVLASMRQRGRGKASGVEVNNRFTHVWTLREGRATRLQSFAQRDDAVRYARGAE